MLKGEKKRLSFARAKSRSTRAEGESRAILSSPGSALFSQHRLYGEQPCAPRSAPAFWVLSNGTPLSSRVSIREQNTRQRERSRSEKPRLTPVAPAALKWACFCSLSPPPSRTNLTPSTLGGISPIWLPAHRVCCRWVSSGNHHYYCCE